MSFTTVEQKIAWDYLETYLRYRLFYLTQLKTAYFKHSEHFAATEILKNKNLLQATVKMCKSGHNMTFTNILSKKLHGITLRHT